MFLMVLLQAAFCRLRSDVSDGQGCLTICQTGNLRCVSICHPAMVCSSESQRLPAPHGSSVGSSHYWPTDLFPANPMHLVSKAVYERIESEVSQERLPPTQPRRAGSLFLTQRHKQTCPILAFRPGCQLSEIANPVPVQIRYVRCEQADELRESASR